LKDLVTISRALIGPRQYTKDKVLGKNILVHGVFGLGGHLWWRQVVDPALWSFGGCVKSHGDDSPKLLFVLHRFGRLTSVPFSLRVGNRSVYIAHTVMEEV